MINMFLIWTNNLVNIPVERRHRAWKKPIRHLSFNCRKWYSCQQKNSLQTALKLQKAAVNKYTLTKRQFWRHFCLVTWPIPSLKGGVTRATCAKKLPPEDSTRQNQSATFGKNAFPAKSDMATSKSANTYNRQNWEEAVSIMAYLSQNCLGKDRTNYCPHLSPV